MRFGLLCVICLTLAGCSFKPPVKVARRGSAAPAGSKATNQPVKWQFPETAVPGGDFGCAELVTLHYGVKRLPVLIWGDQTLADFTSELTAGGVVGRGGLKVGDEVVCYECGTLDGNLVHVNIDGQQFDTRAGKLFLISTRTGKTEVHQLDLDITMFAADPEEISSFVSARPEIYFWYQGQARAIPAKPEK